MISLLHLSCFPMDRRDYLYLDHSNPRPFWFEDEFNWEVIEAVEQDEIHQEDILGGVNDINLPVNEIVNLNDNIVDLVLGGNLNDIIVDLVLDNELNDNFLNNYMVDTLMNFLTEGPRRRFASFLMWKFVKVTLIITDPSLTLYGTSLVSFIFQI